MKIAFDVDGCLIKKDASGCDVPNHEVIDIYRWFKSQGHEMIVWSGSGMDYAKTWADKLGLYPNLIYPKEKIEHVDITFDDQDVLLGKINIKVR